MKKKTVEELREIISNLSGDCGCFDTHQVIEIYANRNKKKHKTSKSFNWIGSFMARNQARLNIKQGKTSYSKNISGNESKCTCWKICQS